MATVNQKEFAKLMGWTPPYVAKLIKQGKIALTADKKVDVDQAKASLAAMRDPAAAVRKATGPPPASSPPAPAPPQGDGNLGGYQQARSVREFYAAKTARLEYEALAKKLIEVDQVLSTWEKHCGSTRTSMRSLPRQLAPLLHGKEIAEIELLLQDAIDQRLLSLSEDPLGLKGRADGNGSAGV